jgi:hypothetical protein
MTHLRQAGRAPGRDPGDMHTGRELTDVVVFDVPCPSQARDLESRLDDQWACHLYEESNITSVVVFLPPTHDCELAPLLRAVEAWVTGRSLGGIMFRVDGRGYLLQAQDRMQAQDRTSTRTEHDPTTSTRTD